MNAPPPPSPQDDRGDGRQAALARLARHRPVEARYEVRGEIARGGMGAILEAFDGDLRRRLAMKIIRPDPGGVAEEVDAGRLHRFLEEAQITAQLTHPGVVPVHELGVDHDGRVFFTMALVQGDDLGRVFEHVSAATQGWSETRALGVLLKVCETLAFAHSRGVIHRDVKPENVMVGAFGEVYVMDWGLAKLAGRHERADHTRVVTDRRDIAASEESSSLLTMAGGIVGTPSFMSPEQARGEELDARSDVYAVGAMLYNLLTGARPYVPATGRITAYALVQAIAKGPPLAVEGFGRKHAPELVAICEKAMARDREQRYATTLEMAEDLRRFLEGRVVRAHRTGAWVEFTKWVRRNRGTAAALAGAVVAVIGGLAMTLWLQERERARAQLLTDGKVVPYLLEQEQELWPPYGAMARALATWIDDARNALSRRAAVERRERALAAEGRPAPAGAGVLAFDDPQTQEEHALMADLVVRLGQLPARTERVAERLQFARTIEERTVTGAEARQRWDAARAAIAAAPVYGGLALAPQLGLLPIAPDPASGLWEFWHVQSGAEPERDEASGRFVPMPGTGIVLVLVPGGAASVGSKPDPEDGSPDEPFRTKYRDGDEHFFEGIRLDAFFLSKYETTRAQWARIMESHPSERNEHMQGDPELHPVVAVSRHDSERAALRTRLELPTEAQWEYACRAGSTWMFSFEGLAVLAEHANFADDSFQHAGLEGQPTEGYDDGHAVHAPVGTYLPNAFGLHDMHGNVWEWCRDRYVEAPLRPRDGDGLRARGSDGPEGVMRGGSWFSPATACTSSNRLRYNARNADGDLGVRFARAVEP